MKNQISAINLLKRLSMYIEISSAGIYTVDSRIAFKTDIEGLGDGSISVDRIDIPDNAWVDRVEGREVVFLNALGIETRVLATRKDWRSSIVWRDSITLSKDEKSKIKWIAGACAKPDRPNIASIALHPKHGLVSTDGHRLHCWRPAFAVSCHEDTKTVSPDILHILKKPEKFEITPSGIYAESSDGLSGFFPWLDLEYPNIDQLFKKFVDGWDSMEVDLWEPKKDKDKIKAAMKFNGAKGREPIVMHLDRTEFGGKKIGQFFRADNVGLDPKYMNRLAGDYTDSWSVMSIDSKHPVLFRSEGNVANDRKALIMPLRR